MWGGVFGGVTGQRGDLEARTAARMMHWLRGLGRPYGYGLNAKQC